MARWVDEGAVGRRRWFFWSWVDGQDAGRLNPSTSAVCRLCLCVAEVLGSVLSSPAYANPVHRLSFQLTCSICVREDASLAKHSIKSRYWSNAYLSPWTKWEPHFEHEKHLRWNTKCWMFWLFAGALLLTPFWFMFEVVRITSSLAGIIWPHAEHAPEFPKSL